MRTEGLELWGGPECTVNRVGDAYRDQFGESGHRDRLSDLDLFAGLGLSAIRYPVLWEHVAADGRWPDAQLGRLRALGLPPIVGLVHHGSGPRGTNLLADDFAPGLAAHARAVAERYPWVEAWTPVNEPVTTARLSALYGHWHPHHRDERSFWLALLNQIDGVRLAMAAVRRVNPAARLVQTDDLGRTYATAAMRDQAAFDNARRWMGWDLLCGRVVPGHDLWARLAEYGFADRLRRMADAPCPPDVIGINHYLTSDRFLDHRVRRYPRALRGGNGRHAYVDTEAVRVLDPPPAGLAGVLREAWARYRLPIAVTEVHNGCTREEQMRWMADAWRTAGALRDEGVDLRAVTAWSLLGSFGWDTLLREGGRYEPGVFDLGEGAPRPTAMAPLLRGLRQGEALHPACAGEGWWRRPMRLLAAPVPRPAPMRDHPRPTPSTAAPLLLADDAGVEFCRRRGLRHEVLDGAAGIGALLDRHRPWGVLADAARHPDLLAACAARGIAVADPAGGDAALDRLIDATGPG